MTSSDYFATNLLNAGNLTPGALTFAEKAQVESAKVDFEFEKIESVMGKVTEEYDEMVEAFENRDQDFEHFKEEIGDCFFSLVNLCRWTGISAEEVLHSNVQKYLKRCQHMEESFRQEGKNWKDASEEDIQKFWKEAKKSGL